MTDRIEEVYLATGTGTEGVLRYMTLDEFRAAVAEIMREERNKADRSADRAWIAGATVGFNYAIANNGAGLDRCIEQRWKLLAEKHEVESAAQSMFSNMIYRYLAAGDQHYASEGKTLDDMFKRLNGKELLIDFGKWADNQRESEG